MQTDSQEVFGTVIQAFYEIIASGLLHKAFFIYFWY